MRIAPMDSRLLKIVNKSMQNSYTKLDDFAKDLQVSTRTIRNYIKQINEEWDYSIAQIVPVKDKGYKLEVYNNERFKELISLRIENSNHTIDFNNPDYRVEYLLKKLTTINGSVKLDDLADEMKIGRTTLVKDLKKVSKIIKYYDLKIEGKTNEGIRLHGSEINIRLLVLDRKCKCLNGESYDLDNLSDYEKDKLIKNISQMFSENNFYVEDETKKEILKYLDISISRLNEGKEIESIDEKFNAIEGSEEYQLACKIKYIVEGILNIKMVEYESYFLTLPLLGRKAPINVSDFNKIKISEDVRALVKEISEEIYRNIGVNIKNDEHLILFLQYHLNFAVNRLLFNIKVHNPLLNDIKQNYPLPYEMAKVAARIIENKYNIKVMEDEIGYIALHFGGYIERNNKRFYEVEKVAVVCGTGLGTAQLLYIKLRKILGDGKVIDIFSDDNVTSEILNRYDIIFTTVDIKLDLKAYVIKIKAIFDEHEVQKKVENIINLKRLKKFSNVHYNDNLPLLNIITREEDVFILNKINYMDNLKYMIEKLTAQDKVDETFKERIIEREEKSPTAFDNYIALPHSINYKSDKLFVAFGIMENPVMWNGNEVKVIILLMIPTEDKIDAELLIKTYEEILTLGQNISLVQKLAMARSYNDVRKVLYKGQGS